MISNSGEDRRQARMLYTCTTTVMRPATLEEHPASLPAASAAGRSVGTNVHLSRESREGDELTRLCGHEYVPATAISTLFNNGIVRDGPMFIQASASPHQSSSSSNTCSSCELLLFFYKHVVKLCLLVDFVAINNTYVARHTKSYFFLFLLDGIRARNNIKFKTSKRCTVGADAKWPN